VTIGILTTTVSLLFITRGVELFMQPALFRAALVVLVAATLSDSSRGESVSSPELGFTLNLPDGFVARPDLVGKTPDIVYAFQHGDAAEGELPVLLFVEKLGGVIGRERLDKAHMPPGFNGDLFVTQWQGFDVDGLKVFEDVNGVKAITYNVQIPLKRQAVQIKLFGRADREAELQPLLRQALDGLKGDSNWLASAAPVGLANSESYSAVLLGLMILIIVVGTVVLWFVARSSTLGVIVIGVALFICAGAIPENRIRELRLVEGSMRMLGTVAILMWIIFLIVNLFRGRKQSGDAKGSLAPIAGTRRDKM
jgi:hypothetical protein